MNTQTATRSTAANAAHKSREDSSVRINNALLRDIRKAAKDQRRTFKTVIEMAIRAGLSQAAGSR